MPMIPKSWAALSDALDEGAAHGTRRALELLDREDASNVEAVKGAIRQEVLTAICERFHFDEPEEA